MNKKFWSLLVIALLINTCVFSQVSRKVLTLDEAIQIARQQSPDALSAMHRFRSSYWQFRNHKAELMPMLALNATLPSLSRSIEKVTTIEGDFFTERNVAEYSGGLSLSKNLGLTGGRIFLSSDLRRLDQRMTMFGDSTVTSYLSYPLNIGIQQPIFGYNAFKWAKRIEPLKYNEAERRYIEDNEQVNINATNAFFMLLEAQIRLKIQQTNMANNDTLVQIARGRYNIGTIAENELLQIELSYLNSMAAVEEANLQVQNMTFNLKSYLRLPENVELELIAPQAPPIRQVDTKTAIDQARENRSDALAFDRRMIEAQSRVSEARTANRFNANLYAVYGLTQSTSDFSQIYKNPQDQQRLEFGITVPILDWGLAKGRIKLAESNMELERTSVQQEIKDFDQEIFIKVMQFNMQPTQYAIASKSDTVALKRYEVTKQRYLIGKIGITDLNIAQAEKDNAQQGYVSALATYWRSFFELRKLTLYDFAMGKRISMDLTFDRDGETSVNLNRSEGN